MRCKNCGSENDDNLYICQNCGSPLYDEDEEINKQTGETQVFSAVGADDGKPSQTTNRAGNEDNEKNNKKKQQTIAVIVILAVILLAIIIGIIIAAAHNSNSEYTTVSTESTTISTTSETPTQGTTAQTTTQTTTETTTQSTTTTTTTTTTEITTFTVTLSCNDGGEVEGDGTYKRGENVTIIAKPDAGYEFDGWYKGSSKVSGNTKYTFTVTDNTGLEAVFVIANTEVDMLDGGTD